MTIAKSTDSLALQQAVVAWIEACREESWSARETAMQSLAVFNVDDLFEFFVNTIRTTADFASRNAALVWLERQASDRIYQLFECLREGDARLHLINLAGRICDPKSLPLMRPFLKDQDPNVVQATIESIGKIRHSLALPWLAEFLDIENPWNAFPAIAAVGNIGSVEGIPLLKPLLEDEFLAPPIMKALGQIGGFESVEILLASWISSSDDAIMEEVVRALGLLWQQEEASLLEPAPMPEHLNGTVPRLDMWTRQDHDLALAKGAFWLLCSLDPELAAALFVDLIDHEEWLPLASSAATLLGDALSLKHLAQTNTVSARLACLEIAAGSDRLEEVAPVLVNDSEVGLRSELARYLQICEEESFAHDYLTELVFDSDAAVRSLARSYFRKNGSEPLRKMGSILFERGGTAISTELIADFPELTTPEIRQRFHKMVDREMLISDPKSVLSVLKCLDQQEWIEQVRGLFLHFRDNSNIQLQLLMTIEPPFTKELIEWLVQVYSSVRDEVKLRIGHLLAMSEEPNLKFWRPILAGHSDRDLLATAVRVVGRHSDQELWRLVRALWDNADPVLRREILLALAEWDQVDTSDFIKALADKDWSVRSTAVVLMPSTMITTELIHRILDDPHPNVKLEAAVRAEEVWPQQMSEALGEDLVTEIRILADTARELSRW